MKQMNDFALHVISAIVNRTKDKAALISGQAPLLSNQISLIRGSRIK